MQPETARPVRLTVPGNDEGRARILADGVQVGHVRRGYRAWEAHLWAHAGDHAGGNADVPVVRGRLRDMRAVLRERVAERGPWWSAVPPDGRETGQGMKERSDETSGDYRTVVADPPWPSMHQRSTYHRGKPERHYPTMPVEEIAALPVGDLAAPTG